MNTDSSDVRAESVTPPLSDREREILRVVVQSFVATAGPVGSRYVSRNSNLGLSPASIRNTMSDLEELGLLEHPYTSAGRVPTEKGYRTFVDELMESPELSSLDKKAIQRELDSIAGDTRKLVRESSKLLGRLTNLLGVVLSPRLSAGVLERLEVVPLSSTRLMFVISVRGGLIRTIILQVESDLKRHDLDVIVAMLNERLAGLQLEEIRKTCSDRVKDLDTEVTGIVQLVMQQQANLFSEEPDGSRLQYGDTTDVMAQPEFSTPADMRSLIELIEDRDMVANLLEHSVDQEDDTGRAEIRIGSAVGGQSEVNDYSLVTARYMLGQTVGTVGVLGPKRMDYARVVGLVEGMAALMSGLSTEVKH
ncbi:MAG: heat-inducible transcription repressor HrcA [Rhodothermales bacterium]|nr:heat-inducible transcription repressor HrcA [Rhodothermales bacterium]